MDFQDRGETDPELSQGQESEIQPGTGTNTLPAGQDVVTLPPGASLDDIVVEGRDLVIQLADGSRLVIPDGAIFVPQIVIDGVTVPPFNIAQLLTGNEPQPAAGTLQSSGGNFAEDEGAIQDAFDLGDLLPFTDFGFPQNPDDEIIPDLVNRDPDVVIRTPNNPAGAQNATASVDEAGLPARGNEPEGTNAPSPSENTTGTIVFSAPDGLASVTVEGIAVTSVGQTIATQFGTLTITGTDLVAGTIDYSYTLGDNTLGAGNTDVLTVVVTENDGDQATATLTIAITDDAPIAADDFGEVPAGSHALIAGDVLVNDVPGADGYAVAGAVLEFGNGESTVAPGTALQGEYGVLTLNSDGTYSYVRDGNTPGGVEESFTYTIVDQDGSTSTATLVIAIGDADDVFTGVPREGDGTVVNEGGLPARGDEPAGTGEISDADGNNDSDPSERTSSTVTFNSPDGVASLTINGVAINGAELPLSIVVDGGTLVITNYTYDPLTGDGSFDYQFTLNDNTQGDTSFSFELVLTDLDDDRAEDTLVITVVDDMPSALDDNGAIAAGEYGPIGGNVVANDTPGADGATVTSYSGTGGSGTTGTAVQGTFGTLTIAADGTYSYTRDPGTPGGVSDTFSYTITDGDGDEASANLIIAIADSPTTLNLPDEGEGGTSVAEAGLAGPPAGSDAASNSEQTTGTFTYTAPDGPAQVTIDGVAVTAVGQLFSGDFGTLRIDSIADGSITYTYTLTTNTSGDLTSDGFFVRVTDQDGDFSEATLDITIVDDVPTANPDFDSVSEDGALVADGNVLTGSGGIDANATDGTADVSGADGASVTAVAFGAVEGEVGIALPGAYGTFLLNADGSYTYTLNNEHPLVQGLDSTESLTEVFTYTITDGDGDSSTTTVTIQINGQGDPITIGGLDTDPAELTVDEDDLAVGSSPDDPALTQTGSFTITSQDGLAQITAGGLTVWTDPGGFVPGQTLTTAIGTFVITAVTPTVTDANGDVTEATVSFSYVLNDNSLAHSTSGEDTILESFAIEVTDTDGSTDSGSVDVLVIDDVPTATDQAGLSVAEDAFGSIGGNVITDGVADTQGADGATVTSFTVGAVTTVVPQDGSDASYSNANGTYTMDMDGNWTFDPNTGLDHTGGDISADFTYTLTDGDGDFDTATQPITITDGAGPLAGPPISLTVDDENLPSGSNPNPAALSDADTIVFTPGSDAIASIEFGASVAGLGGGLTWVRVDGDTITGSDGGDLIVTLQLTTVGNTATVTATLSDNYDSHPTFTADDLQALGSVDVVATDIDGDTATSSVSVSVSDDVPDAIDDGAASVAEDAVGTIGGNVVTNDTQGADGATVTSFTVGAVTTVVPQDGSDASYSNANGTYTMDMDGNWTFDPNTGLDHTGGDISADFTYTLTDGDGDFDTATQPITITDGAGPLAGPPISLTVDDENLPSGSNPNPAALSDADTIVFTPGSDAIASIEFGASVAGLGGGLTWVRVDGDTITGSDGGDLIVTLQLTTVGNTATVTATLSDNYDSHPTFTADDLQALGSVDVVATDIDGDTATSSVSVSVSDDVPDAIDDGAASVAEDAVGTIGGNVVTNDTQGADGATVTSFTVGAVTTVVPQDGSDASYSNANGTYTMDMDGNWTFDPNTGLDHTGGDISADFTYTLTDGDGDFDTATQPITITDGAGPLAGPPISLTVDDENLPSGSNPNPAALSDADTIVFTPGSDAIASIEFGASVAGLGGGLTWVRVDGDTITGSDGGDLIVTLQLTTVGNTATVTATLSDNYDSHPTFTADDLQALGSVDVVATDIDGDTATSSVSVSVSDDVPDAIDDGAASVAEDAVGTIGGNVVTNDTQGADGATVTSFTVGAVTTVVPQDGSDASYSNANGTYTMDMDGNWTFDPNTGLDHTGGDISADFTYTLTDGDGDFDTATQPITITDGAGPLAGPPISLTVDDENLPSGSNPNPAALSDADTIVFTPGSDAIASIEFGASVAGLGGGLTWVRVDGDTITGSDGGDLIVTLQLTTVGNTATVTATLSDNYDSHPTFTADDLQALGSVDVVATDIDGDTATSSVSVSVSDDVPDAIDDGAASVAEDAVGTIGGNVVTNDTQGADGATVTSFTVGAVTTVVPQDGSDASYSNANGTYTMDMDGNWTFDPNTGLDHTGGDISADFTYTLTDGDGDFDTATQPITITDGAGPLAGPPISLTVDDENLPSGSNPNPAALSDADTIVFTPGSDAIASIEFGASVAGLGGGLTWVRVDGDTITGSDGGDLIVTLQLTTVGNTATVTATLSDNYDSHPTFTADDLQALGSVDVVATDIDGDTATSSVSVSVSDDVPDAIDDGAASVAEDAVGTIGGNVVTNDTQGADGATVTSFTVGAVTTVVPQDGSDASYSNANGTYTMDMDGNWTFDPNTGLDHTGGDISADFTYTLTDGDGDFDTATQPITITDGAGPLAGPPISLTVDDENLPSGSNPNPAALSDADTIVFTPGSDAIASIEFGASVAGLGGGLTWVRVDGDTITGSDGGDLIVTLQLTTVGNTATVTATLSDNYDSHPTFTADDLQALGSVDVVATDIDGDTATSSVSVSVSDDVPDAIDDGAASVAEDAVGTIGGNVVTNDTQGADGATVTSFTVGAVTTVVPQDGSDASYSNANGTYTMDMDGNWTFDPNTGLDHTGGDISADFTYTLTDGDGDFDTATQPITITDGAGPLAGPPISLTVDDENLPSGSNPNPAALSDADTIVFTPGSDAIASIEFGASVAGLGGGLTWVRVDGDTITGSDGGDLIVTLQLTTVGNTATVTATLSDNYDSHPTFTADDLQALGSVDVVATDIDGDTATSSVSVSVSDDVPDAIDDGAASVAEDAVGTIGGNVVTNDTQGADGATVTSFTVGAVTTVVPQDGSDASYSNANGTYTMDMDGNWTFDPNTGLDHTGGDISADFTYTLTDGDGDFDTATQPITITDGAGPLAGPPISLTVDDENLPSGSNPNPAALSDADTIVFTPGSDAIASIEFGASVAGLGGGLTWVRVDGDTITGSDGGDLIVTLQLTTVGNTATVTATLSDNYDSHPTFTADDLQALGSVDVVATDIDGDTATSSVSVSVSDDVPMAFTPVNLTDTTGATGTTQDDALPNDGTANVTRLINDPDNDGVGTDFIGADGFGSLTFVNGTDGDQLENTSAETVTSGGLPVYLFGFGTGILTATTDNTNTDAGAVVFTMTLNPGTGAGDDASYTIDFDQPLDDGSGTVLSDFGAIRPNNYDWVGFTSEGTLFDGIDNDGEDILITAFNANTHAAGTVNMSSSDIGSNNQWVDEDETVRIDFVIDGTGAGNEKTPQAYGFDGHLDVTNASFTIIEVKSGGSNAIVTVALFDDDDSGTLQDLNGSPVNVLAGSVVVTDSGGNDITGSGAIVVYNGDGTVTISGLAPGDNIAFEGDGLFNAFEITGGNGDDFSLGAFGFTSAIAGRDVPLSFDIQSEDADGDTSTGSIDVTVTTVAAAPLAAPTSSQSIQSFSTSTTLLGDPLTDPNANDNGSGSGMAGLSSIQFHSALRIGTRMSEISAVAALSGAVLLSEQIAIEPASTALGADTAFDMLAVLPTGIGATFAPELSGIDSFDPSSLLSLSVAGPDASDLASLLGTQDSLSEGRWSIQSVQAELDQFEPLSVIESQGEATPAMALPTSSGVDASMEALLMLDPAQDLAALDGSGTADAVGAVMSEIVAGAQLDAIIDRFDDQSSVSDYLVTASGGPDVGILDHHFEAGVALIDAAQLDTDQAEAAIAATAQA